MISHEIPKTTPRDYIIGKTLRDGEYLVQHILGRGEKGSIYLASHTSLSIPFVLKQMPADQPLPENVITELHYILHGGDITRRPFSSDDQTINNDFPLSGGIQTDRFLHEALLLARLQHPAIPTLYDYFSEDGYWYLVMDYIPGVPLSILLHQYAPLPIQEALDYALQLCDVLNYLHTQTPPLIFCDLKPEHIIITPDRDVMLIDFGNADYLKDRPSKPEYFSYNGYDGQEFDATGYAPPKQFAEHGLQDTRSDLYSLGIILYEMLSEQALSPTIPISVSASKILNSIIKLAIQPDPRDRFQSAQILYLALERAQRIEERRSYQQILQDLATQMETEGSQGSQIPISDKAHSTHGPLFQQEDLAGITPHSLDLEQRKLTREALYRARRNRLEQEQMETQFDSVDESLRRRSSISLSLRSLDPQHPQYRKAHMFSPTQRFRRSIQISFLLALILFLIMMSLLIYEHIPQITIDQLKAHIEQPSTMANTAIPTEIDEIPTTNYKGSLESYWQHLPSLPGPAADNAAAYIEIQGRPYVYINGGYRGHAMQPRYDHNLYRYDIDASRWETIMTNQFPSMVNNAATADQQGHIFFTSGYSPESVSVPSRLFMYQPRTNQLKTITPPPDMPIGFAGALFNDGQKHLYITEGFLQAGNARSKAGTNWYRYDIASNQWKKLANMPAGLGYVVLASDGQNHILMLGGSTDAGQMQQTNKIYSYDISSNSWSQSSTSMNQFLSGATGCMIQPNKLVLVGGYDPTHNHGSATTTLIDLQTLQSTTLPSLTTGGSVLGTIACDGNGHAYMTRGADHPQQPTRDFWKLVVQSDISGNH
jgi:serine/threonine protein kinase